jgi:shikimate kinase
VKKNIILIGFMGIGKGTTARALSRYYDLYVIDTDDLIESKENRSVKKIFEEEGESCFRAMEQQTADWIEEHVSGTLISCGGGFYKVNNINKLGQVVLLDASFEWIYHRIINSENAEKKLKKRPLFTDPKAAKKRYDERKKAYRLVADVVVNVEQKSLSEIVRQIGKLCKIK